VDAEVVGAIGTGFLVLLGATHSDTLADVRVIADKLINLRVFEDEAGKMNLSLQQVAGSVLTVSQFTLYADVRRGRRPAFVEAMAPEPASALVDAFVEHIAAAGIPVQTGRFGAMMQVELLNSGPVTILLESREGVLL
jgi:D-tyrosyl-tRNA(Tyr) deacylase